MKPNKPMIDTQDALLQAIDVLRTQSVIAVDTEFIREKTYYPQLCLIQIAYEEGVFLIDPLSGIDLGALREVFCNPAILKVFHSGQQDLEIMYHLLGEPTRPLFDTQVAAALVGMTDQVSYATFIKTMLDHTLKKNSSFSVWSRRPLTASQIEYAKDDVLYLLQAYPLLRKQLEELGRLPWLEEEFAYRQTTAYVKEVDPHEAYRTLKRVSTLSPRQAAIAREVAAWRQRQAQRLDRPRRRILPDESIIEIARKQPLEQADLENIRGINMFAGRNSAEIIAAVRLGKQISSDQLPILKVAEKPNIEIESSAQLARALVHKRAKEHHIAPNVLANNAMIEEFVRTPTADAQLLQGWRKILIGEELLDLVHGELALSIHEGKLQVISFPTKEQA